MALEISWRDSALNDLERIARFIARKDPRAALRIRDMIHASVIPASTFPYMFKTSRRIHGCHEVIAHPNYIVLYRVKDRIEVVAVVHARQARMPEIAS